MKFRRNGYEKRVKTAPNVDSEMFLKCEDYGVKYAKRRQANF